MNYKDLAKKFLPSQILTPLVALRRSFLLHSLTKSDRSRFRRFALFQSQEHVQAQVMFYTHSLEKGLSHASVRLGFGKNAFDNLNYYLPLVSEDGEFVRANALSAMSQYIALHENSEFDEGKIRTVVGNLYEDAKEYDGAMLGGAGSKERVPLTDSNSHDFPSLFEHRVSIREFSSEPVSVEQLEDLVALSRKAPSVCNRQSSRVAIITDEKKIADTLAHQGGFVGYRTPPALLLLTTDLRTFLTPLERNEPYVDGGIFLMALLMFLENAGLGACALNTMLGQGGENSIREILDIPEHEVLIAFIAVGNLCEHNRYARSARYPSGKLTRVISS